MITISFYGIGIPIGVYLLLKTNFQVIGYWMGFVAAALSLLLMQIIFIYKIDWTENAQKAFNRSLKPSTLDKLTSSRTQMNEPFESNQTDLKKSVRKNLIEKISILIFLIFLFVCLVLSRNLVKVKEEIVESSFLLNATLPSITQVL